MVNFANSINATIFMTLQISRKCLEMGQNIPALYLSVPGCGKTKTLEMFAKVNGYALVLLRVSNETPDAIMGYDIADTSAIEGNATSAKHIRPSWFQKILDNDAIGKRSLLFLDELTTADVSSQAAALNLVFDRRCHAEYLPKDTLIAAAGNFAASLSNEMTVLAPMLNRFMIINLLPESRDLKPFLCRYDGALGGNKADLLGEVEKMMIELKNQEMKEVSQKFIDCVGEYIQQGLYTEAMQQMKEGVLDLKVTELKDVYSDQEVDEPIPNFFSFRSVNYLLDAAIACYICFGKAGLLSDNFKNCIHGLVGLALSRDPNTKNVRKTIVTERYYEALADVANDIEKMSNDKLPEYTSFFNSVIPTDEKASMSVADMNLVAVKLSEMLADKDLSKIDRPVEPEIIKRLSKTIKNTINSSINYSISPENGDIATTIMLAPEEYVSRVSVWNTLATMTSAVFNLVSDPKKKYTADIKNLMNQTKSDCRATNTMLKQIRKSLMRKNPSIVSIIPEIQSF